MVGVFVALGGGVQKNVREDIRDHTCLSSNVKSNKLRNLMKLNSLNDDGAFLSTYLTDLLLSRQKKTII